MILSAVLITMVVGLYAGVIYRNVRLSTVEAATSCTR